jgi:hypothetical protein
MLLSLRTIKIGNSVYYPIFVLLVLFTLYADSPLQGSLGFFGETMIPVMTIPVYCFMLICKQLKKTDSFLINYKKLLIYVTAISIVYFSIFLVVGIPTVLLGENLVVKGIKLFIQFYVYYAYMKVLYNLACRFGVKKVLAPFYWGLILMTAILFVELAQSPFAFESLHYTPGPYWRIRLLNPESSYTSLQLEIFATLAFFYSYVICKSRKKILVVALCFVLQVALSGSKTLLVAVALALIALNWKVLTNLRNWKSLALLLAMVGVGVLFISFVLPQMIQSFVIDIEEFSSTVTRFYSIFCGFEEGFTHPFGVGFQSYLYYFPKSLTENKWIINMIDPDLNLVEIDGYISAQSAQAVSAKSFLAQTSIYWGILGTFYFVRNYVRLVQRSIKNSRIPLGTVISIVMYIILIQLALSSGFTFEIQALLVVLMLLKNNVRYKPVEI